MIRVDEPILPKFACGLVVAERVDGELLADQAIGRGVGGENATLGIGIGERIAGEAGRLLLGGARQRRGFRLGQRLQRHHAGRALLEGSRHRRGGRRLLIERRVEKRLGAHRGRGLCRIQERLGGREVFVEEGFGGH